MRMPKASDMNLQKGITLLHRGLVFESIREFQKIRQNLQLLNPPDQVILFQQYNIAINTLLNRYIAVAHESLGKSDQVNTILLFMNLINLYSDIRNTIHKDVNYNIAPIETLAYQYERWVVSRLETINNRNFSYRKFKKKYEATLAEFSSMISFYNQALLPLFKDIAGNARNFTKIQKLIEEIGKQFIEFYLSLGNQLVNKNNLLRSKEIVAEITKIYDFINKPKKLNKKILQFQVKVLELAADCEIDAGISYREMQNFEASVQHLKIAFIQYRDLDLPRKQQQAKNEYLNTCILSAKSDLRLAKKYHGENDQQDALFHYQQAISKLNKINAKKMVKDAQDELNHFYEDQGDSKAKEGRKFISNNVDKLRNAENIFEEVYEFYYKAENLKKQRETQKLLAKIRKDRFKLLEIAHVKYQKNMDYEHDFLVLEELHYLSYNMEDLITGKKYARAMEKIKEKVNFSLLEQLKSQKMESHYTTHVSNMKNPSTKPESRTKIILSSNMEELPDIFSEESPETTPFFDPINEQTILIKHKRFAQVKSQFTKLQPASGLSKNSSLNRKEIKEIYQIIKKFNHKKYLLHQEVQILLAYGINLPQDGSFYFKFDQSQHQFFVHESQSGIPLVLMIPSNKIIEKRTDLGVLADRADIFIPTDKSQISKNLTTTQILESHILLAINHPQWNHILEGFQFSTLNHYFYFLHAIRLIATNFEANKIARYLNSSVIAEKMNIQSDHLEKYLKEFPKVYYLEEMFLWSTNNNFRLLFTGMLYLRAKKYSMAALMWNMLEIS